MKTLTRRLKMSDDAIVKIVQSVGSVVMLCVFFYFVFSDNSQK